MSRIHNKVQQIEKQHLYHHHQFVTSHVQSKASTTEKQEIRRFIYIF